jgi:hypothetical protein
MDGAEPVLESNRQKSQPVRNRVSKIDKDTYA